MILMMSLMFMQLMFLMFATNVLCIIHPMPDSFLVPFRRSMPSFMMLH